MELGKLPALFEHYQKHRAYNINLTFLSFLEMHYADEAHHTQDHKEHHKLPFTDHHKTISLACVYYVGERNFSLTVRLFSLGGTNQSVYQSIVEEDITVMVWQPPRIA